MHKIMLSASSLQKLFKNPYEMRTHEEVFQKLDIPGSIETLPVMVHIMPFKPDSDFGSCIHIDDIQKLKKNTSLIFTAKSHTTAYYVDENRDFFCFDPLKAVVKTAEDSISKYILAAHGNIDLNSATIISKK